MVQDTAPSPSPAPEPRPAPWPSSTSPSSNLTYYHNVYCGDVEGKLEVSDEGLWFRPYVPSKVPANNATSHDIFWTDVTHREFFTDNVSAGYGEYSTPITFYHLKVGVLPNKESVFALREPEEYQRLQCDLDARGHGAPPDDVQPEEEEQEEQVDWDSEDDEDDDVNEADRNNVHNMRQTATERNDDDSDFGFTAADATGSATPNSSYYPVQCKREVGSLVLTANQLQFIPDRHSAAVKTLPYRSFAAKPLFSPWSYPRAQMDIHYHTTRGPQKKASFLLASQDELVQLEDDIHDRIRPFKNAPRVRVHVPPSRTKPPPVFKPSKQRSGFHKKSKVAPMPAPVDASHTEDTTAHYDPSSSIRAASIPLVATTARRVPYHKDEERRRLLMLFMSYCCIATMAGLIMSILFGYFFGPRRPREGQYIRTESPYDIGNDYLGTNPPTQAPTPRVTNLWNSGIATMSRGQELGIVPSEPEEKEEPNRGTGLGLGDLQGGETENVNENENEPAENVLDDQTPLGNQTAEKILNNETSAPAMETLAPTTVTVANTGAPPTVTVSTTTAPTTVVDTSAPSVVATTSGPTGAPTTLAPSTSEPTTIQPTSLAPTTLEPTSLPPTTEAPTTLEPTTSEPTTGTPTLVPTTLTPTIKQTRSEKPVVNVLMDRSFDNGQALRTSGTPQQAAYLLLKVSGALDEAESDEKILQKYALSTLYYALDGKEWGEGSSSWKDMLSDDCVKEHVVCDEATKDALRIDMPHNNMKGTLPPEIAFLEKLKHISFKDNDLEGTIPTEIGLLKNLEVLDLSGNPKLQGTVPEEVRNLPSLKEVKSDLP